jgi:hypothetical protein
MIRQRFAISGPGASSSPAVLIDAGHERTRARVRDFPVARRCAAPSVAESALAIHASTSGASS